MTDEAFIRAIVDSPGDDLPRLAYADWLDERNDPRGPYLRAECEWAKPWRAEGWEQITVGRDWQTRWMSAEKRWGVPPGLIALAAGLDPVWVARVSRHPVGVCCEVVRFPDHTPLLSTADVAAGEARLGLTFPPQYRAFLLNYNGGQVRPAMLLYWDGGVSDGCYVETFIEYLYSLLPYGSSTYGDDLEANHLSACRDLAEFGEEGSLDGYLCIGRGTLSAILLKCTGDGRGSVWDFSWEHDASGDHATPLAASLPHLLCSFTSKL